MELVRTLKKADRSAALALWQARFFDSDPFCSWYFTDRFFPELSAGLFLDGELITMALGRPMTLVENGRTVRTLMVAGVSTRVGFERRGYMKRVMAHVEVLAKDAEYELLVLRPVDQAIYLPIGYLPYSAERIAFGTGKASVEPKPIDLADALALFDIYTRATASLTVSHKRTSADMVLRLKDIASDGGTCIILPDAYALIGEEAVEAVAASDVAYTALLDALPEDMRVQLPPNAPIGACIPHVMAKAIAPHPQPDRLTAANRYLPEEY